MLFDSICFFVCYICYFISIESTHLGTLTPSFEAPPSPDEAFGSENAFEGQNINDFERQTSPASTSLSRGNYMDMDNQDNEDVDDVCYLAFAFFYLYLFVHLFYLI